MNAINMVTKSVSKKQMEVLRACAGGPFDVRPFNTTTVRHLEAAMMIEQANPGVTDGAAAFEMVLTAAGRAVLS